MWFFGLNVDFCPSVSWELLSKIAKNAHTDGSKCGVFFELKYFSGVNFDANEVTMAAGTAIQDERKVATGGIVGFRLAFEQKACTYA